MKAPSQTPRLSLLSYFESFAAYDGEVAFVQKRGYRTERWSYARLAETASQFARELEARSIGQGDRVLLWGANSAEWVAAFWGCLLRGVAVVPMDDVAAQDFARRVAQQVNARLMVCSADRTQLDPALPALPLETLAEAVSHHPRGRYALPPIERSHMVQIVFTSGTTAEPKGVVITHGNILANLEPIETEIRKYLKYERFFHPLRFLNLLPLSHVFGQFLGIFLPPLLRATVLFQDSLNPSEVLRTIKRKRVTVLVAVPRVLETLRGKIERDIEAAGKGEDFRKRFAAAEGKPILKRAWHFRRIHRQFGWKFWAFISGGAALPADVEEFWMRLGFGVIQGYGLTETTSLISVNHPLKLGKGSVGKIIPGQQVKRAPNGEILVRGENIASSYWAAGEEKPVAEATAGEPGWFHTGDLGELDAEGNLYFKGRKKNVIVTPAGMNVHPEDLEAALRRQPEVRDCVVVALERDGNAEPCAVLLLRDGVADLESVIKRANESLADYQRMRRWLVWPEQDFPRTGTQKPRINLIAEAVATRLGEKRGAAPEATAEKGGLADLIARITNRAPEALAADAKLESDLHLSSLDRVELMSAIEDRYQIDLNETRFAAATTVGELEHLLRQSAPRRSDYHYPAWAQRWPITWIRLLVYYLLAWPATWLLGSPSIRGRENLRGMRGPVLVIANHTLYLDVAFVLAALPMRLRHRLAVAMAGERLRSMRHPPEEMNFLVRWVNQAGYALAVTLFNVFPLPQHSGFRESFQFAGESVDRGYNVLVFPEGELTPDGKLARFRSGIGLLANKLNIQIVPVRIDGLFELKQRQKRNARLGQIRVTIGAPIRFPADTDPEQITRELETRVAAL